MKTQLVLFALIFIAMSLVPLAGSSGSGASDGLILLILSLSLFGFFYQDRIQRNTKNILKQAMYLILCLMSLVFSVLSLVLGSRDSGSSIAMVGGTWFLLEGTKNIILRLTRRPVDGEYQGLSLHPYKKDTYVPWFYYQVRGKVRRGCPDGPWERGSDFPRPGESWTVFVSPLSPLDCALTARKFEYMDFCMILVGLSIIRRVI